MGAPVGPTGCEHDDARVWIAGLSYGSFSADLVFDGRDNYALEQQTVVASLARRLGKWSVRVAAGGVLGGELVGQGRAHQVRPGLVASVTGAVRLVDAPLVSASFTLAWSQSSTVERVSRAPLRAGDARLGVLAGWPLWGAFTPYLAARAFGGPVWWRLDGADRSGTDRSHYTLGAGASLALPWGVDALVDWAALGERGLSVGASLGF